MLRAGEGYKLAASAGVENRSHDLFRDVAGYGGVAVFKCGFAKLDRFLIARQIAPAIQAHRKVLEECIPCRCRQVARKIISDEVCEFAAGHDGVTSQKILIAPFGFCKRVNSS